MWTLNTFWLILLKVFTTNIKWLWMSMHVEQLGWLVIPHNCKLIFLVTNFTVFPPSDRPAPRFAPTSVGRWSTCGSPWMGKMWIQCWRSWAFVSTDSSTSTYSSTATAQWEACWPSATWLNTVDAPRTSGWAGGIGPGYTGHRAEHGSACKGSACDFIK